MSDERPPVAVLAREGDPYPAIGVAVVTSRLSTSSEAAIALGALTASRLAALPDARVTPSFDGYRIRVPLRQGQAPGAAWDAVRAALLTPVRDVEVAPVMVRVERITRVADASTLPAWSCKNEPFVLSPTPPWTQATLEALRRSAHGTGRVTIGVVGVRSVADSVAERILGGEAWPPAPRTNAPASVAETTAVVASPDPRAVHVTVALWTPRASQAVAAAAGLHRGTLGARLGLLDAPGRLRDITAVAHPEGGCVAVELDLSPGELGEHAASRVAAAAALVEEDVTLEAAQGDERDAGLVSRQGREPEEAAERAAWWLATVDAAAGRSPFTLVAEPGPKIKQEDLDLAMKRARTDLAGSALEKRARAEPGQGELWLLLGSPCGTGAESLHDAGFSAAVAHAAARGAQEHAEIEPWVTSEGVGVLVHGPRREGESADGHARRLADVAGRALAIVGADPHHLSTAQAGLLRASELDASRAFTQLARVLSPGHPSWIHPLGSSDALARASAAGLAGRGRALLSGPMRVALLGETEPQVDAAARTIDRWLVRRPGDARGCAREIATKPKPGTYALERTSGGTAEVFVAAPLPAGTDPHLAHLLAAALDGEDGPLDRALAGAAREWGVRVVGPRESLAIVVRVSGSNVSLDPAVEKVRAVLAKARALDAADLARAQRVRARTRELELRDPARRVAWLFSGDLEDRARSATDGTLRGLADEAFRPEGLLLVALRPPSGRAQP